MKLDTLTTLSIVAGALGVLALLGAWLAGPRELFFGLTEQHLFADAAVLLLIAIWLKLGAIYHRGQ